MAARGKAWIKAEDDVIRLLSNTHSYRQIAKLLGRGKSSVGLRIAAMEAAGTSGQAVMDLGQADANNI